MTPIKPLAPKVTTDKPVNFRRLGFRDGLEFSFGFWVGSLFFFAIVGPAVFCLVSVVLSLLGKS